MSQPALSSDSPDRPDALLRRSVLSLALALRETAREHRVLLLLAFAYIAAGAALQLALGRPWPVRLTTHWFASVWVWGSTIWLVIHVIGRLRGRRTRLAGHQIWGAILLAALAVPVQITFQSVKQSIGAVRGFSWDERLADIDRALHGGAAWHWYAAALSHPTLLKLIDLFYVFWFVALAGTIVWLSWTPRRALRQRALLAILILWIGAGNIAAWTFASAGPCYRTDRDPDAAALVARLDTSKSASIARINQRHLWAAYRRDKWEPLGGVSAMPSLHVGMMVLVAIITSNQFKRLGLLMWAAAAVVHVGSVILGWHYAIDGYAGAACAWAAWAIAGWMVRRGGASSVVALNRSAGVGVCGAHANSPSLQPMTIIRRRRANHLLTLVGVFLLVFAIVALSGPGRIDIVDGQTRFEVAKSLALQGDFVVRNPDVWFSVFPGRNGDSYSYYRFPHSVVGAVAILVSDLTGPQWDGRRHFFFALTSAVAAAVLACVYFTWFTRRGLSRRQAVFWAIAGILCTPNWFYGTSTFDDIFAALAVTGALAYGLLAGPSRSPRAAFVTGLLFGLAFNVKQPVAVFVLPAIVAFDPPDASPRARLSAALLIAAGLAFGVAAYFGYELYKFPPGTKALHAELLKKYLLPYPGHFWWGLAVLGISPAAGIIWYGPSVLLAIEGLRRERRANARIVYAFAISAVVFFGFIASLSFCKGDPSWGPRYLTPLYAALWLFAPDGARRLRVRATVVLLALGLAVQVLALSVDPERLHLERRLPSMFGAFYPVLYFDARVSGLLNRPREIVQIWRMRHERVERFSWSDPATAGPRIVTWKDVGADPINGFARFTTFRPWWSSHQHMAIAERPVSLPWAAGVLGLALVVGAGLIGAGTRE